jgi:ubiquinone/menaquinone biosynthesis C-methylase UbiE
MKESVKSNKNDLREVEEWVSAWDLQKIYTSSYWNDIEEEKKKAWWIGGGDYGKCINYLKSSGLLDQYNKSKIFIDEFPSDKIRVLDLAAGIGWTSALLSKMPNVSRVDAVEISKHRLCVLFQHAVKMLEGDGSKIYRYLGSFYEMKFPDKSIDIIYMSQAFHHADSPLKLLVECDRVLSDEGRIILVGEHYIGFSKAIFRFLRYLVQRGRLSTKFFDLFPPEKEAGDHYYLRSHYYFMFSSMGYAIKHLRLPGRKVIYVASKSRRRPEPTRGQMVKT